MRFSRALIHIPPRLSLLSHQVSSPISTKTGSVAAPVERLAGELGRSVDELLGALTASGLRIPEKSREKPVFAEHAGEIFWLNLNGKGELWLNAKVSKYSDGRRPKSKKRPDGEASTEDLPQVHEEPTAPAAESSSEPSAP